MMWSMPFWKPHALAHPHADQLDLRMGDRVRTTVDLPTVVAGTEGKVILANGFNWQRYRVCSPAVWKSATSINATSSQSVVPPSASPSRPLEPPPRGRSECLLHTWSRSKTLRWIDRTALDSVCRGE